MEERQLIKEDERREEEERELHGNKAYACELKAVKLKYNHKKT